jgi:hypothetical protein
LAFRLELNEQLRVVEAYPMGLHDRSALPEAMISRQLKAVSAGT